jgi:hypothetical protein
MRPLGDPPNRTDLASPLPSVWAEWFLDVARILTGGAAGDVLTAQLGAAPTFTSAVACSAYHTATQNLVTATWTVLALNAEDFDTAALHDPAVNNSRVVAPSAGTYLAIGQVHHGPSAGGTTRWLALQKNSGGVGFTNVVLLDSHTPDATYGRYCAVSGLFRLVAGDYFELAAYQDSGLTQTVGAAVRLAASALQLLKVGA